MEHRAADAPATPLSPSERARGRRFAIASHPAGNTFAQVFTNHLPTLALVALGAGEALIGFHQAALLGCKVLQLPTLRAVARFRKRHILVAGQVFALVFALPLLFFGTLARVDTWAPLIVLTSLVAIAAGLNVSGTVWFPLLRSYVESDRVGHFFGILRSGWSVALIAYYLAAQRWLAAHPGDFAPLFQAAWALGLLRIALIVRLPEQSERTRDPIHVRDAFELVRRNAPLRRYLLGVTWSDAVRFTVIPFAIVMMRREVGFSDAQVLLTTVGFFAGGLVSLYVWGRVVDRIGPEPIFRWTSLGMGALILTLVGVNEPGQATLVGMIAFFFALAVLQSGFGVADTHVLFALTPPDTPARTLVPAQVISRIGAGTVPILAGIGLDLWLGATASRLDVYHVFFSICGLLVAAAFLPLRAFRR